MDIWSEFHFSSFYLLFALHLSWRHTLLHHRTWNDNYSSLCDPSDPKYKCLKWASSAAWPWLRWGAPSSRRNLRGNFTPPMWKESAWGGGNIWSECLWALPIKRLSTGRLPGGVVCLLWPGNTFGSKKELDCVFMMMSGGPFWTCCTCDPVNGNSNVWKDPVLVQTADRLHFTHLMCLHVFRCGCSENWRFLRVRHQRMSHHVLWTEVWTVICE